MNLAFVTASLAWRAPDGGIYTNAGLGRLIEAIAARVGSLTVAMSHVSERGPQHDHRLQRSASGVPGVHSVRLLPSMPTMAGGMWEDARCRRVLARVEADVDASIVQLPFSAPTALLFAKKPRVYHVCADLPRVVAASPFYRGVRRTGALFAAHVIDAMQRSLVTHNASVVTNGTSLWEHFGKRGRHVVSSSLHESEIASVTRRRSKAARKRVLFVGFLRPEKGIDTLVDAFDRVVREVPDAELVVVGGVDAQERGAANALLTRLDAWIADGRARRVDALPFGPALFQEYADADVLVLPSRSEGTPRVLVEARAFGCPVVATRVGGIPTSVDDGVDGVLIEPNDPRALAAAILRVLRDDVLRARLVKNGAARAHRSTVEAQAQAVVAEVSALVARTHAHRGADAPGDDARGSFGSAGTSGAGAA